MSQLVYGVLTFALCWLIACRIDKMNKGVTKSNVFLQHFLLGFAVFVSWIMGFTRFADWSDVVLAGGVFQFFLFSIGRWRKNAPTGTAKELKELPKESLTHVAGGVKK